jgi:histidyl-tRNA synthetase
MGKKKEQIIRGPRGMEDMLPEDWQLWRKMETAAREVFELSGYYEIRTPIFEDTRLFVRSIGETTDIVEKEMYTFMDGKDSSLTLRPEYTAPVMRSYIEYELYKTKKFQKFYYIGPLFRKERPQAGRLRQFHQMGIEAIGAYDALLDAETIDVAVRLYNRLGLEGYKVKLNSIGCEKCRPGYRKVLRENLDKYKSDLCDLCNARLDRNVFRVLDCKRESCKEICRKMPPIDEYLCEECKSHFGTVKNALTDIDIEFIVDPHLVRGLDYYTKTVYEITHPSLGARDTICAGGRYDKLISDIGGPPTGAVGFAAGMEATMLAIQKTISAEAQSDASPPAPMVYIVSIGEETRTRCFSLLNTLRTSGISADLDYEGRSTKAQMRTANKLNTKYVLVIGPDELANDTVKIKDMQTSEEKLVEQSSVVDILIK